MRNFFTLVFGPMHSDELYEYLLDLIEKYELDTYNISNDICDLPDDIILAVLTALYNTYDVLIDIDLLLVDYLTYHSLQNVLTFNYKVEDECFDDNNLSPDEVIEAYRCIAEFTNVVEEINKILNSFG